MSNVVPLARVVRRKYDFQDEPVVFELLPSEDHGLKCVIDVVVLAVSSCVQRN